MPAVEPSPADSKPAEATEAAEVLWICGRLMRKATNDSITVTERERSIFSVITSDT